MGLMFGSPFGPIGALGGALLGFIYGNLAAGDVERQSQAEAQRQESLDRDVERQIEARNGEAGAAAGQSRTRSLGVTVVKDHLADEPARPRAPATASSDRPAGEATPRVGAGTPGAPAGELDAEGFRSIYEGGRLVRRERDMNKDGQPDTIVHYGADGGLVRREESSRLDGRIDVWTYYTAGQMVRREADTRGEGVDLWVYYDGSGGMTRAEALVEPGRKLIQVFTDGQVTREEWRRQPGDVLQTVLTYRDGKVTQKEEDSTGSGRLDLVSVFDASGRLVKQGRRADEDRIVSWRHFDQGGTLVREEELGVGGTVVAVSFYEGGRLTRRELYELDEGLFKRAPLVSERWSGREG
jgi:hypothetical protein